MGKHRGTRGTVIQRFVGIINQEEFQKSSEPFLRRWQELECGDRAPKLKTALSLPFLCPLEL